MSPLSYLRKRYLLDRILAAMILVVMSPAMLVIAVLVRLANGRPVMFRQQRVGRHGELFSIIKFRTMVVGAEQIGAGYTPAGANLITPVGQVLRKSSLDELPQLINIVRGDMALIGPRPSLVGQYERYTSFQRRRLDVLPGITGLAQVTYRDDAPWSKRIELDVRYVDQAGPMLDLRIMGRTFKRVLSGSGVRPDVTRGQVDDLG
jgi:lipopolysaccharide/colanic/teichoic acid biosynthesis glycosyltransferase